MIMAGMDNSNLREDQEKAIREALMMAAVAHRQNRPMAQHPGDGSAHSAPIRRFHSA